MAPYQAEARGQWPFVADSARWVPGRRLPGELAASERELAEWRLLLSARPDTAHEPLAAHAQPWKRDERCRRFWLGIRAQPPLTPAPPKL